MINSTTATNAMSFEDARRKIADLETKLEITQRNLADAEEREEMLLKAFQQLIKKGIVKQHLYNIIKKWDIETAERIIDFCNA